MEIYLTQQYLMESYSMGRFFEILCFKTSISKDLEPITKEIIFATSSPFLVELL